MSIKRAAALLVMLLVAACDYSTEPELNQLTLTITGSGSGQVTFSVAGAAAGTCGTTAVASCTARYSNSELVTLSAVAAEGSTFAGWSGACTGTAACVLAMSNTRSVTATFNAQ